MNRYSPSNGEGARVGEDRRAYDKAQRSPGHSDLEGQEDILEGGSKQVQDGELQEMSLQYMGERTIVQGTNWSNISSATETSNKIKFVKCALFLWKSWNRIRISVTK